MRRDMADADRLPYSGRRLEHVRGHVSRSGTSPHNTGSQECSLTATQPLEVVKTTMAANRSDGFAGAISRIWGRGGVLGCELNSRTHFLRPTAY